MRRKKLQKYLAAVLAVSVSVTSIPWPDVRAYASEGQDAEIADEMAGVQEAISESEEEKTPLSPESIAERSENKTVFDLGGGRKKDVLYSEPVRFENEAGELVDYDASLVGISDETSANGMPLDGYAFENRAGDAKHYLPEKLSEETPIFMEKGDASISFYPLRDGTEAQTEGSPWDDGDMQVRVEEMEAEDLYGETSMQPLKAVYEEEGLPYTLEYVSCDMGVKESIILEEAPQTESFTWEFRLEGLDICKNPTDEGFTFYDKETGDMAGGIEAPYMNDATGEAYSDAFTCELQPREGETDTWLLTIYPDMEYLQDEARVYPVVIDPTVTWTGSNKMYDVYVCNGSYAATNFYSSGVKVLAAGKSSQGLFRTYMQFFDLGAASRGYYIESAKLDLYEGGDCKADINVQAYRVKESWKPAQLTWNNQPAYDGGTVYDTIKTAGSAGTKHTMNLTKYVREIATSKYVNCGIVLRTKSESKSSNFTQFYNSRYATASKRPKFTVVYYDAPAKPASVSTTKAYYKRGEPIQVNWTGIDSKALARVEYRIAARNDATGEEKSVLYDFSSARSLGQTASGTAVAIPGSNTWSDNCWKISLRGADTTGLTGAAKACVCHVDGTAPVVGAVSITPSSYTVSQTPSLAWSSVSDAHLKSIQYQVNGGGFEEIGTGTSGRVQLPADDFPETGVYTVQVRALDMAGNVSAVKSVSYYLDQTGPAGTVTTTPQAGTWTEADPVVNFTNVADANAGMDPSTVRYSIVAQGQPAGAFQNVSGLTLTAQTSPYAGSFQLAPADRDQADGKYTIYVRFQDKLGNTSTRTLAYYKDKDKPQGSLSFSKAADSLSDTVQITASMSDGAGSGIKNSTLRIKNSAGGVVETVYSNFTTDSVTRAFHTKNLPNGAYLAELTITDKAGHTAVVTQDIQIKNGLPAPGLQGSYYNVNYGEVTWNITPGQNDSVSEMEYRLSGESAWTKVADSAKNTGTFGLTLPRVPGGHTVYVRAINRYGVPGAEAAAVCVFDRELPTVQITSFVGGMLKGTVTDDYFDYWEISVKEKNEPESAYRRLMRGTQKVQDGLIKKIGLDERQFTAGVTYDFRLTACDKAQNSNFAVLSYTVKAGDFNTMMLNPQYTVKRPLYQRDAGEHFLLPENTNYLEVENKTGKALQNVTWYIDDYEVAKSNLHSESGEVLDFYKIKDGYNDQKQHRIIAKFKDEDGNISYSVPQGKSAVYEELVSTDTYDNFQRTLNFAQPVSSFTLKEDAFFPYGAELVYQVQCRSYGWATVEPAKTYHISELFPGLVNTDQLLIRVQFLMSARDKATLRGLTLTGDSLLPETFRISEMDNYVPTYVSAVSKINYKTYLTWSREKERAAADYTREQEVALPENVTYEVFRATGKGELENQTAAAVSEIHADYLTEMNINYGREFYYRIRAVRTTVSNGKETKEYSSFSPIFSAKVADGDEYVKCLGDKDYWSYEDFSTPNGTGGIELSRGNFYYGQAEAVIPNNGMPVELGRAYNSQASTASSLGMGWNHSYDLELLNINESDELKDRKAIKDATGTIFLFEKNPDGTYASSMGKYITLKEEKKTEQIQIPARNGNAAVNTQAESAYTMLTKDNVEYRFNAGGQLVYEKEPNGSFVLLTYDSRHGRLIAITTNQNLVTRFSYADNASDASDAVVRQAAAADAIQEAAAEEEVLSMEQIAGSMAAVPGDKTRRSATVEEIVTNLALVRSITLPDGGVIRYHYDDLNLLTMAERMDGADGNQKVTYRYAYDDNDNLSEIRDALGNAYRLEYTEDRVTTALYPAVNGDQESIRFTYSSIQEGDMVYQTSVRRGLNGTYGAEDFYKSSRNGNTLYTRDTQGVECTYTYEDNMLKSTSTQVDYQKLIDNKIVTETEIRTEETVYDPNQNMNPIFESDADGKEIVYEYENDSNELVDDQPTRVVESVNGNIIADDYLEYDEFGNEISEEDMLDGDILWISYFDEESEFSGEEKQSIEKTKIIDEDGNYGYQTFTINYDYTYDENGFKVETITETMGKETIVSVNKYDDMDNLIYEDDGQGNITTVVYDFMGREIQTLRNEKGTVFTSYKRYDKNGTLEWEQNIDGIQTYYKYDARNRLVEQKTVGGDEIRTYSNSYEYEWYIDALGNRELHYIIHKLGTEGNKTSTYFNQKGWVLKEISNGVMEWTDYDRNGKAILQHQGNEDGTYEKSVIASLYDVSGRVTNTILNPLYNLEDCGWYVTDESIVNSNKYDVFGNVVEEIDGEGNKISYVYDSSGNLLETHLDDGTGTSNITSMVYDVLEENGMTSNTVIDANGNKTKEYLDAYKRIIRISDIGNENVPSIEQYFEYDANGNLIQETFSNGDYKKYFYDTRGNIIRTALYKANGIATFETEYTYSTKDQLLTMADYKVNSSVKELYRYTSYQYDAFNQITGISEFSGSHIPNETELSKNRMIYSYDLEGRIATITFPEERKGDVVGLEYAYDSCGHRTDIYTVANDGTTNALVKYVYTSTGELREEITYRKFRDGNTKDYIKKEYTYDKFDRVVKIEFFDSTQPGVVRESYTYTYDKNFRIVSETIYNNYAGLNLNTINETHYYKYDSVGRIIEVTIKNKENQVTSTTHYAYDKVGNRLSEVENGIKTIYKYNSLNQLIETRQISGEKESVQCNYAYDLNGNMIKKMDVLHNQETVFTYTVDNYLEKEIQKQGTNILYTQENLYNGNRERILKKANNQPIFYYYQNNMTYASVNQNNEIISLNFTDGNGNIIAGAYQEPSDSFSYSFYNRDLRNSTSTIQNENGKVIKYYRYDEFGKTEEYGETDFENENCYIGGIYDQNSGLYYLNARYYSPSEGRFLSQDTYRGEVKRPSTLHLYAYCSNDPIDYTDISGHKAQYIDDQKYGETVDGVLMENIPVGLWGNVAENGCGSIAVYNALVSQGYSGSFLKINEQVSNYYLLTAYKETVLMPGPGKLIRVGLTLLQGFSGKAGISPRSVYGVLKDYFKVVRRGNSSRKHWRRFSKNAQAIVTLFAWKGFSGAHYVTGVKKAKGHGKKFEFHNLLIKGGKRNYTIDKYMSMLKKNKCVRVMIIGVREKKGGW